MERFDPVPRSIPEGIPAPDDAEIPLVFGNPVEGIGYPGPVASGGSGISDIVGKVRTVEVQKPKPPIVRTAMRVSSGVQESRLVFKSAPGVSRNSGQARASGPVVLEGEIDEEGMLRR